MSDAYLAPLEREQFVRRANGCFGESTASIGATDNPQFVRRAAPTFASCIMANRRDG